MRTWRILIPLFALAMLDSIRAAELTDAVEAFRTGKYDDCTDLCHAAIEAGEFSETWRFLKIESELAAGRFGEAQQTFERAAERFSASVRLRWLGVKVARALGDESLAAKRLDEIEERVRNAAWQYSDPPSRVTLGRFYLVRGIDAKQVLDATFTYIKKTQPDFAESYLAAGQLALEKHDYALAAEEFERGLKLDATDPEFRIGLARAYAPSDDEKATEHLQAALARNPRHVDSLLFLVDSHIDAERYGAARELLQQVFDVNPLEPRAWAYRAILAHLRNDSRDETLSRGMALAWWPRNPVVDHLIGQKLSQKYRFREGAAHQRRALEFDPNYQPARIQLSQDLLRLGEEDEGWQLAEQVFNQDGYQIVAHNLTTLRDHLKKFRTLTADGLVVKMDAREADLYGARVLALLHDARTKLCAKYEVTLERPVLVEIFPEQQDFAIRTFGLPGGAGFLGVCFGNVITANSPASQGESPSNWQAVLWHEFCHVVTLNKTSNAMPRWLSEGISVYEERQANPTWGQWLTPEYRTMLLGDDLTPVSQLSGAFLQPKSPTHLQFAYFESSLVVEFLVERYGFETLKKVLVDLGAGMPINESLARYAGSLDALDHEFADYARKFAAKLGSDADWTEPDLSRRATTAELAAWVKEHPKNITALKQLAAAQISDEQWAAANVTLRTLAELLPEDRSANSIDAMQAVVARKLGDAAAEKESLLRWSQRSADAVPAYLRLLEMAAAESNWTRVVELAQQTLAVNPLLPSVHRQLARAAEQIGARDLAIEALRAELSLSPLNPVDVHYRLACLLQMRGELLAAKRHVLQALEDAPRFRAGHQKLLELTREP